jgi:hypothetical protein
MLTLALVEPPDSSKPSVLEDVASEALEALETTMLVPSAEDT